MRRWCVLAWLLSAIGCGGTATPAFRGDPGQAQPPSSPLVGLRDPWSARPALVRVEGRRLRPVSRPIALRARVWGHSWSPDRTRLAVGAGGRVRVVDVDGWRDGGTISLGGPAATPYLAWPRARRILALDWSSAEATRGWVLDPEARRVVRRFELPSAVSAGTATATGLAVLTGGLHEAADAELRLIDAEGRTRAVAVPGMRAGGGIHPAVAADPVSGRLYLADAERLRVLEVDGASVTEHDLDPPEGTIARLLGRLEATAHAKASDGPTRRLHVVGEGLLALGGHEERAGRIRGRALLLVDTRSWAVRRVAERVSHFVAVPGALLVLEADGSTGGVTAYGLDGRRRWSRLAGRHVERVDAAGRRVHLTVSPPRRATITLDLRTGRRLGRRPGRAPALLPAPASR